jgi:hypothetical protein
VVFCARWLFKPNCDAGTGFAKQRITDLGEWAKAWSILQDANVHQREMIMISGTWSNRIDVVDIWSMLQSLSPTWQVCQVEKTPRRIAHQTSRASMQITRDAHLDDATAFGTWAWDETANHQVLICQRHPTCVLRVWNLGDLENNPDAAPAFWPFLSPLQINRLVSLTFSTRRLLLPAYE